MRKFWVEVGSVLNFFYYENMENIEGRSAVEVYSQILSGRMFMATQSIYQHIPTIDIQQKSLKKRFVSLVCSQRKPVFCEQWLFFASYMSVFQRFSNLKQIQNYFPQKGFKFFGASHGEFHPMVESPNNSITQKTPKSKSTK